MEHKDALVATIREYTAAHSRNFKGFRKFEYQFYMTWILSEKNTPSSFLGTAPRDAALAYFHALANPDNKKTSNKEAEEHLATVEEIARDLFSNTLAFETNDMTSTSALASLICAWKWSDALRDLFKEAGLTVENNYGPEPFTNTVFNAWSVVYEKEGKDED
jgi:hypothetical protein